MLPPWSAHHSSLSCAQPWLRLTWDGVRAEVLFFIAGGVSQYFMPDQSPACSTVEPLVRAGVREGLSSFSFITPPTLNTVFQILEAGLALSSRLLPFLCSDPVRVSFSLFTCLFLNTTFVLSFSSLQ